jgi:phage-related protein
MASNSAHFICLFVHSLQNICCIYNENNVLYLLVNNCNICCIIWICLILLILLLLEKSICAGARALHFIASVWGKVFFF